MLAVQWMQMRVYRRYLICFVCSATDIHFHSHTLLASECEDAQQDPVTHDTAVP